MRPHPTFLFLAILAAAPAAAEFPDQPHAAGIESSGYVWNQGDAETRATLGIKGDPALGKATYRVCIGCHKADGSGVADAEYPALAGQHTSVLIKQMLDVRNGRRDSPKMYPFIGEWLVSTEEIAHLAAYLNAMPVPTHNGKGNGDALAHGKALYERDCARCHGALGEGDGAKFSPRLAGQHFRYLRRESIFSRDSVRRNASVEMVNSLKGYTDQDIEAVCDYLSRQVLGSAR